MVVNSRESRMTPLSLAGFSLATAIDKRLLPPTEATSKNPRFVGTNRSNLLFFLDTAALRCEDAAKPRAQS